MVENSQGQMVGLEEQGIEPGLYPELLKSSEQSVL